MTAPSLIAVAAALAAVLGAVVLLAHCLRRVVGTSASGQGPGRVEVLSRAGLGPRQGVATVRIAGRMIAVSYGEGGVRHLADLDPEGDAVAVEVEPQVGSTTVFPHLLAKAGRRVAGLRALMLLLVLSLMSGPVLLSAQAPSVDGATVQVEPSTGVPGAAPSVSLQLGGEDGEGLQLSGPVGTVVFIGFMTLIPTLLLLMTSFTRILIVLHLLKQALGTQTAPPAHLLAAMALLLTGFVMAPTFEEVQATALTPWMDGETDEVQMLEAAAIPMRAFMLESTRDEDLVSFLDMRDAPAPETIDDVPLVVVTSAFVTSELTSAFQMGFALFLPFVVIDVVVASVLMSMGMFMLPPVMVSLPFKLLLFVLVDGWSLVIGSLVQSF